MHLCSLRPSQIKLSFDFCGELLSSTRNQDVLHDHTNKPKCHKHKCSDSDAEQVEEKRLMLSAYNQYSATPSTDQLSQLYPFLPFTSLLEHCLRKDKDLHADNNHDILEGLLQKNKDACTCPPLEDDPTERPSCIPFPTRYLCYLCFSKFPSRCLLLGHMLYTCHVPYSRPRLKGHPRSTDVFYCEKCLRGFPSLDIAVGHSKFTCDGITAESTSEMEAVGQLFGSLPTVSRNRVLCVQQYRCPQCWRRFPAASLLEGHIKHTCVFNVMSALKSFST